MINGRTVDIAPSILSADFSRLGEEIEAAKRGGATILHVDVMDGHFVPNLTVGLPVVKSLSQATDLPIDAHLMISEPGRYAQQFVEAGAKMVSVHVEADAHLHRTLASIKAAGGQAGVVLNPATPVESLTEALPFADYVLVMSVNPGFGGQKFIANAIDKLRRLRRMIGERELPTRLEIDGGIDLENIASVVAAGAEIIVAGSAIFGAADPEAAVRALRQATVQWI
ncbi:MAG TPA: ribulose-phosphate 3-epimerase [Pyrinomonadaceae bacterium]|jgi:ribulose-phosphate 3-epimerase|nr:ribulose-phosphate 3-epimerase [Pyrinomonadaceae bacterium]